MGSIVAWIILLVFGISMLTLGAYGMHLYVLVYLFRKRHRSIRERQQRTVEEFSDIPQDDWPIVTTQIPLYNERDVSRRVIEAVAAMDYPVNKHEIQVLDDSTDTTRDVVDAVVAELSAQEYDVKVVRRPTRDGYKAGALGYGLMRCRGQLIAMFDADFIPPRDFLRRTVPLLVASPGVACVQARWTHINERESWLTRAQALALDVHFAIEQGARSWNGLMMNFNGTAGVWRKAAIDDPAVGGWSGDTLVEDMDLSYRAQMAGWMMEYCFDLECPAELPSTATALKSQQRRWATGAIQTARKLLPRIWGPSSGLSLGQRLEATFHLSHHMTAIWMLLLALIARPLLILLADQHPLFQNWFWGIWVGIVLTTVAPLAIYGYARFALGGGFSGFRALPYMLAMGLGLCINNSFAVLRGLFLTSGEFVRTPKSGSGTALSRRSSYRPAQDGIWLVEIILGLYTLSSLVFYLSHFHSVFSVFLFLYAVGFLTIGWQSRPPLLRGTVKDRPRSPEVAIVASADKTMVTATVGCAGMWPDGLNRPSPQADECNT